MDQANFGQFWSQLFIFMTNHKYTILNGCIRNKSSNVATVGYNYVRVHSDRLHVQGELFGKIFAHHH